MTHTLRSLALFAALAIAASATTAQEHAKLIKAHELWQDPWNLRGAGTTIGFFEYGYPHTNHTEFRLNRVSVENQPNNVAPSSHTTGTIGVAVARGARAAAKGVAYKAKVEAFYIQDGNSQAEVLDQYFNTGNYSVTNHSYSSRFGWLRNPQTLLWEFIGKPPTQSHPDPFGAYLEESRLFDEIVHESMFVVPVVSSGNTRGKGPSEGDTVNYYPLSGPPYSKVWTNDGTQPKKNGSSGYDCLPPTAVAKNVITVGAVNKNGSLMSFSQTGPTNDGRVKPDVVALGDNVYVASSSGNLLNYATKDGTSYAAPAVTGVVAQLQELFRRYFIVDMLPSTAKAILTHTAQDLGNTGPDYRYGWGLVNAKAAALLIHRSSQDGKFSIDEEELDQGETHYFEVKALAPNNPIRVTLSWVDPAGTVTEGGQLPVAYSTDSSPRLVNDLDLRISEYKNGRRTRVIRPYRLNPSSPSSTATRGRNIRDNVEQVVVTNPDPDAIYRVIIDHEGQLTDGPQLYSRCVSGAVIHLRAPSPVQAEQGNIVLKDDGEKTQAFTAQLSWRRIGGAAGYQVRYKRVGTSRWTYRWANGNALSIPGLDLGTYYFQVRARRGNRYSHYATRIKTFTFAPKEPTNLQSGPVGSTSAIVRWTGDANAEKYRVLYARINMKGQLLDNGWSVRYTTNTATSLFSLAQDTWYAWSVQSVYDNGVKSGFAPTEAFLTNTNCQAYEPNNAIDLAAPIETNRSIYARACKDDVSDWYSFTVTNWRRNVKIYLYQQPVPLQLQLFRKVNGSASKVKDSPNNGNNSSTKVLIANNLTPGTYYVRVFNPDASSSYSNSQEYPLRVNTRSTPY